MKIRIGFISNSSSSSFVILGNPVPSFSSMKQEDFEELIKTKHIFAVGPSLNDGYDGFDLTVAMWKEIVKLGVIGKFELIEVYHINTDYNGDDDRFYLYKNDVPVDKFVLYNLEIDNHSSRDVSDLKENFKQYRNHHWD